MPEPTNSDVFSDPHASVSVRRPRRVTRSPLLSRHASRERLRSSRLASAFSTSPPPQPITNGKKHWPDVNKPVRKTSNPSPTKLELGRSNGTGAVRTRSRSVPSREPRRERQELLNGTQGKRVRSHSEHTRRSRLDSLIWPRVPSIT